MGKCQSRDKQGVSTARSPAGFRHWGCEGWWGSGMAMTFPCPSGSSGSEMRQEQGSEEAVPARSGLPHPWASTSLRAGSPESDRNMEGGGDGGDLQMTSGARSLGPLLHHHASWV